MVTRTYEVRTYGCKMNVHDSERIAGLLDEAGYALRGRCAAGRRRVQHLRRARERRQQARRHPEPLKLDKDRTPGMPPLDSFVVVCRSRIGVLTGAPSTRHDSADERTPSAAAVALAEGQRTSRSAP